MIKTSTVLHLFPEPDGVRSLTLATLFHYSVKILPITIARLFNASVPAIKHGVQPPILVSLSPPVV